MNETAYNAAGRLVSTATAVQQGRDARRTHERHIRVLIEQVLVGKQKKCLIKCSVVHPLFTAEVAG